MRPTPSPSLLILRDLEPMHWAVAGVAIAVIAFLLLWTTNRRLGISTSFESLCALGSRLPYFRRPELQGPGRWRLLFFAGLALGGLLSALLAGGWSPFWDLGMFDAAVGAGPAGKSLWMFVGGLLIGIGTRLADGCTSGHGVFGLANREKASLVAVAVFLGTGILVANLLYRVVLR